LLRRGRCRPTCSLWEKKEQNLKDEVKFSEWGRKKKKKKNFTGDAGLDSNRKGTQKRCQFGAGELARPSYLLK